MAKATHHVCMDCDVEFRVKHELEDDMLSVVFCPFCGESIEPEEEYELSDEDEEE